MLVEAAQKPERNSRRDGDDERHEKASEARHQVTDERIGLVAVDADGDEGIPHLVGRREKLVINDAKRGHRKPENEDAEHHHDSGDVILEPLLHTTPRKISSIDRSDSLDRVHRMWRTSRWDRHATINTVILQGLRQAIKIYIRRYQALFNFAGTYICPLVRLSSCWNSRR